MRRGSIRELIREQVWKIYLRFVQLAEQRSWEIFLLLCLKIYAKTRWGRLGRFNIAIAQLAHRKSALSLMQFARVIIKQTPLFVIMRLKHRRTRNSKLRAINSQESILGFAITVQKFNDFRFLFHSETRGTRKSDPCRDKNSLIVQHISKY